MKTLKNGTINMTAEELQTLIANAIAQAAAKHPAPRKPDSKPSKKTSSSDWEAKKAELAELSENFVFTQKMDTFIKKNPSCSKKDLDEKFGCKGMTRDMLKAHKRELGVR